MDPYHFVLKIKFDDQSIEKISLTHIFEHPKGLTSEILRGGFFHQCFIENGALAWPNGFELCPDALRLWSVQKKPLIRQHH